MTLKERVFEVIEQFDAGVSVVRIAEAVNHYPDEVEAELLELIREHRVHAALPSVFRVGQWRSLAETVHTILFLGIQDIEYLARALDKNTETMSKMVAGLPGVHLTPDGRVFSKPTFLSVLTVVMGRPCTAGHIAEEMMCDIEEVNACLMHLYIAKRIFVDEDGVWHWVQGMTEYRGAGICRVTNLPLMVS